MAARMKAIFTQKGYPLHLASPTNQQFVVLTDAQAERLREHVAFSFWERLDGGRMAARFATSWSTTPEDLRLLEAAL